MVDCRCKLNLFGPVSPELEEDVARISTVQEYKKGSYLLRAGEVCSNMFLVTCGTVRVFYKVGEQEITLRFVQAGELAVSLASYYNSTPAEDYIEVIEDSIITSMPKSDLYDLFCKYPEFGPLIRKFQEETIIFLDEQPRMLHRLSAKERYVLMRSKYPRIFQVATVEQIASYLDMTRETLSRIMSRS